MVFPYSTLRTIFELKIVRIIFALSFLLAALGNLVILSSLQTHEHDKTESVLNSLFLFHAHKNVSIFRRSAVQNSEPIANNKRDRKKHVKRDATTVSVKEKTVGHRTVDNTDFPASATQRNEKTTKNPPSKTQGDLRSDSGKPNRTKNLNNEKTVVITAKNKITPTSEPRTSRVEQTESSHPSPTQALPNVCETWCRRGNGLEPPYNITAVLLVRIYREDLAGLTSREMLQWLQYLRYAGFQHVYVYDAYVFKSESQRDVLDSFIQSGYVTYVDWSRHNPYTISGTQVAAYQDCLNKFGSSSKWQAAIDIDEYPFSPSDLEQNFLERSLLKFSRQNPKIVQVTMKNYLFLGKPLDHVTNPLLIDRIRRRTKEPANALVKPIYRPANIRAAQVHHNSIMRGGSMDSEDHLLRMNHYWGARLQNWGEDTPKVLRITEPDFSIQTIIENLNRCAECLGPDTLHVRRWN